MHSVQVSKKAIQEQVRWSLRYTKPVNNLEYVIQDSLRKQTELGIVTRSGSSMYAMTIAFQGLRSDRSAQQIKKKGARGDSLTTDQIARVRKMLRGVQKPLIKVKRNVIPGTAKAICKTNSVRNLTARSKKPPENSTPIKCEKSSMSIWNSNIPKKVYRHVFKAVKYYTDHENYMFVPLDKIKMEVKWTMRNLNPLKDLETVIEHSLTNLRNIGVLSELLGSYRLNRVNSLHSVDSYSIFGKVSKSFFPVVGVFERAPGVENASSIELGGRTFDAPAPLVTSESLSQEIQSSDESQNISCIKVCEMPLDEPMSESIYLEGQSCIEPGQTSSSSLVPMLNFRAPEGVLGVEPTTENAPSLAPFENPFCVELPLMTSANSSSRKIHNTHTECELGLRASSPDLNISFIRAAKSFHESWLQSNYQPSLLREASYEPEQSNEAQNAVSKHQEEPEEQ
nr:uncharacterized protein LOC108077577 isoform X2 [Drosophila kikkawai]